MSVNDISNNLENIQDAENHNEEPEQDLDQDQDQDNIEHNEQNQENQLEESQDVQNQQNNQDEDAEIKNNENINNNEVHYEIDNKESEQEENDNNNETQNEKELETQENHDNEEIIENQTHLDGDFNDIYSWVDTFKFKKPKKNLVRDFSDGVNLVEILASITKQPLIQVHTVSHTFNKKEKMENWKLIQKQMNKKSYVRITDSEISDIVDLKPGVIELVLERIYKCRKNLVKPLIKDNKQNNYINNIPSK